jgi:hypothetical protein
VKWTSNWRPGLSKLAKIVSKLAKIACFSIFALFLWIEFAIFVTK